MHMRLELAIITLLCVVAVLAISAPGGEGAGPTVPKVNVNYAALDKLGWQIGAQAYTFRAVSLFETIDILNAMGVRSIELFPGQAFSKEKAKAKADHNMSAELIEELQKKLKECNVQAVCYGVVGLSKDEAASRKVFEFCKKMGIATIQSEPAEDAFATLDKLTEEYRINVALHNHPKPSHYWDSATVLTACEGHSKRIGSGADTGHWYRSGLVPLDCLKKLEGRITASHFKDLDAGKGDVPFGTGVCDAKAMLAELKRQGFKGAFSIEYERTGGQQLINNVAKCVQWFSDTAGELAGQ